MKPHVSLLSCWCGHGGDAWHEETYGQCTYPKCSCKKLDVEFAIVDHKRVSSFELKKLTKRKHESQEFNLGGKSSRCYHDSHKLCEGERLVKCECNCHNTVSNKGDVQK